VWLGAYSFYMGIQGGPGLTVKINVIFSTHRPAVRVCRVYSYHCLYTHTHTHAHTALSFSFRNN